jgi:hypothetical protein
VTRRAGPNPISFVGAAGLVLVLYSGAHVSCFGLHSGGPIMVLWAFSLIYRVWGPWTQVPSLCVTVTLRIPSIKISRKENSNLGFLFFVVGFK